MRDFGDVNALTKKEARDVEKLLNAAEQTGSNDKKPEGEYEDVLDFYRIRPRKQRR